MSMFRFLGVATYLLFLTTAIQVVAGSKVSPELQKTTESKVSVVTVETAVQELIHHRFLLSLADCVDLRAG